MKRLKWYQNIDSYNEAKNNIQKNTVCYTRESKESWFKENYITAHYVIENEYNSGAVPGSVDSLGMTNVLGGMQHYSRKIVNTNPRITSSQEQGTFSFAQDNNNVMMYSLNDNIQVYENDTITNGKYSYDTANDCWCFTNCDDSLKLNKLISSLKFNTTNGTLIEVWYETGGENYDLYCDICNNKYFYSQFFDFDNTTYFTLNEDNEFVATNDFINYINEGISYGYKIFFSMFNNNYETISYSMIVDDTYTINAETIHMSYYELQVFDYYETEILEYVSEIYINGERQSEVAPYYYIMSETNEFDVKIVFNTSNIPSMYAMFEYCDALTWVDFKHLKLDKGILNDTSYMFSNCYSLIELKNLEYFDTSNVINMRGMFQECYSIGCANGRGLKPSYGGGDASVDNLGVMPLSYNIQTYESMESDNNEKSSCEGGTIDIKHDNNCSTSYFAPTYDSYVSINTINGTSKLTFNGDIDENNDMVACICISRNGGSNPESLNAYSYGDCEYIEGTIYVPLSSFTKVSDNEYKFNNNVIYQIEQDLYYDITHISFIGVKYECMDNNAAPVYDGNSYATDLPLECCIETQLYCECVYYTFDLSKLNVSNVQNMSRMFQYCNSVHYINMSTWNTSNVIDMYQMFSGCGSLLELDFYNFNLGNLTDFGSFISNCYSLNFINMNCYMNPNTEYSNNSYNFKENGTIVLNENYTYNEYFLNNLTQYNWNTLPSQLIINLFIVENGLEVTEGSVLVNDEALTYNSESGKWEGVTLNVNDVNVIITYNDNEYDININSIYLFVGDNNSSYS